jgi:iron(III) transport system ATP-binding protein
MALAHERTPIASVDIGPALSLEEIGHAYDGVEAVRDVSLAIGAGEVVCLLGPSGCGKTTILRVAAGLERLQRGRVAISGRTVAAEGVDIPPEERGVGLVFQDYALFPHLSVRENVAFGLRALPAAERRQRALAVLQRVGLAGLAEAFPHTLSGGQQQRVALARALAPQPRVMLLDEPFSGLDTRLRDQVRDETLHVLKDSGTATLLVTHDPEEAMFMADRIAVMRAGRMEQLGQPADLYCQPANAFVAAFFGDVNRLDGTVRDGRVQTPFGAVAGRAPPRRCRRRGADPAGGDPPVRPGRVGRGGGARPGARDRGPDAGAVLAGPSRRRRRGRRRGGRHAPARPCSRAFPAGRGHRPGGRTGPGPDLRLRARSGGLKRPAVVAAAGPFCQYPAPFSRPVHNRSGPFHAERPRNRPGGPGGCAVLRRGPPAGPHARCRALGRPGPPLDRGVPGARGRGAYPRGRASPPAGCRVIGPGWVRAG